MVGLSFSIEAGKAWYVPCSADRNHTLQILNKLKPVFEHPKILKIAQNLKFDMLVLRRYGVTISAPFYDTMLAHYLIEPDQKHGMDYLSESLLGYTCLLDSSDAADELTRFDLVVLLSSTQPDANYLYNVST